MSIRSLIIDDDPFIQDLLQDKLRQHLPDVKVVGVGGSGTEGLDLIRQHQPELIFLDVELRDMTGFGMLNQLPHIPFQIIFVTSYSHYAIKAIRFNALDYILKPIDLEELIQAVDRYKHKYSAERYNEHVQHALRNLRTPNPSEQSLVLHLQEGELRLSLKEIVRIEAERNYSFVYLDNGRKKLCAKTLGDFEDILSDKGFFRTHKSHLVNREHILRLDHKYQLRSSDGAEIPISRRKKDLFENWYEKGTST